MYLKMEIWIVENSSVPALEAQPCLSSSKVNKKQWLMEKPERNWRAIAVIFERTFF